MSLRTRLYSTSSYEAMVYAWILREKDVTMKAFNEHVTEDERIAAIFEPYMSAAESGYVRVMTASDVVSGSTAKPGWYGFFDGDGDIVFWAPQEKELRAEAVKGCFFVYARH